MAGLSTNTNFKGSIYHEIASNGNILLIMQDWDTRSIPLGDEDGD